MVDQQRIQASGPSALAPRPAGASNAARLPDFFIVGQPKCGTTALYQMLRSHPQIFMPDNKEPWFFAEELHERTPPRPAGTPRTLAEYAALFAPAAASQRAGEASVLYLWSRTAAGAIARVVPEARIIAILREPASLLRSLHLQFVETYVETETDLRTALALEPERARGLSVPRHTYWPRALRYSEHVRYVEQLRRYGDLFGAENMLVLVYDDFRRDNAATVRRVLRFLEVDDSVALKAREVNLSVGVRAGSLRRAAHALAVGHDPLARAAKAIVKPLLPKPLRPLVLHSAKSRLLYAPPAPPDEVLMQELRERFRPEVAALSEYLGRDLLSEWGYGPER